MLPGDLSERLVSNWNYHFDGAGGINGITSIAVDLYDNIYVAGKDYALIGGGTSDDRWMCAIYRRLRHFTPLLLTVEIIWLIFESGWLPWIEQNR